MQAHILSPERLVVTARRDLRISRRRERDEDFYFVEDPLRNKFFRLGPAEHALFAALDGHRTLAEAAADTASSAGPSALTQDETIYLAEWLVATGLASNEAGAAVRTATRDDSQPPLRSVGPNLWSFRITLGSPDRWLAKFDWLGRMVFGRAFFVAWFAVVVAAMLQVLLRWSQLVKSSPISWGWRGAMSLGFAWCLLKLGHEFGHAIACRRFGGEVGNVGLAFVLGMPSPFVDVSSICRSPDKWKRIAVSLGGIYFELFAASIAVLVWSTSHDIAVRQGALTAAIVASIGSLAFNLNPLMRFDGYFALSDLVELPNLAAAGKEESQGLLRRCVLGIDEPTTIGRAPRPIWVAWYGLAAMVWRVVVVCSLLLLGIAKLGVIGTIAISLPLLMTWLARCSLRRQDAIAPPTHGPRNRVRQLATCSVMLCLAVGLGYFFDPRVKELAAVVDYEPLEVVRAASAGFVRRVLVADGEHVVAGQKLLELENAELSAELARAELAIEQSLIRSRMHRQAGATTKEQAEQLQRQVLEAERNELRQRYDQLTVVAASSGTIVSHNLDHAIGRWVEKGDEIASIGDDGAKALQIAVPQRLVAAVTGFDERAATAVVKGHRRPVAVRLTTCEPRASTRLLHPALSAEHGGATIVRRRDATPGELGERDQLAGRDTTIVEAIEPCFGMKVRAEDDGLRHIAAGRTATVTVRVPWRTALEEYLSRASAWLHDPQAE